MIRLSALLPLLLLAACDQSPTPAPVSSAPADPHTAAIYQRACKACHESPATGAPLTGDLAAWQPRMAQGMDTLLAHVVDGFGGMPPLGLCMDCSAEEFEALIHYMAQPHTGDQP